MTIKKQLQRIRDKRVAVIGDIGLDLYTVGSVDRISPEAPVPILDVTHQWSVLGLAANVAHNIHALGGKSALFSVIGKDRAGETIRELLEQANVSTDYILEDSTRRTTLKERIVAGRQQLLRVDHETLGSIDSKHVTALEKKFKATADQFDSVVIEDYAKGTMTDELVARVCRIAKTKGLTVFCDPNRKSPIERYKGVTVLTPNLKEAEALSGMMIQSDQDLKKAADVILKKTKAEYVIVTRGPEGMTLISRASKTMKTIPTYAQEVADVSGAGDTVIAMLCLASGAGLKLNEAMVLANGAAGVVVGKMGTATATTDEVAHFLEGLKGIH